MHQTYYSFILQFIISDAIIRGEKMAAFASGRMGKNIFQNWEFSGMLIEAELSVSDWHVAVAWTFNEHGSAMQIVLIITKCDRA